MRYVDVPDWRVFVDEDTYKELNSPLTGKWMYFYVGREGHDFAEERCAEAVEKGIVSEAKVSDNPIRGASCYYLKIDDLEGHKRVIQYFLDNDMIQRTKAGRLHNISFKLNTQTRAGEYGNDYHSELKLEELMDLDTGEWLV